MKVGITMLVGLGDGFLFDNETVTPPLAFSVTHDGERINITIDDNCVKGSVVRGAWVELSVEVPEELLPSVCSGEHAVKYRLPSAGGVPPEIDAVFRAIYADATWALNLLITSFRVAADQLWLEEIPSEPDYIGNFFRRVQIAELVAGTVRHTLAAAPYAVTIDRGGRSVANQVKIEAVRKIVEKGRVPLAAELLANAERHYEQAHYRAAIVEVAAAIEATMHRFANRPDFSRLDAERVERLGLPMSKIVGDLGMRACVRLLLPLIVPEAVLDDYAVEGLVQAIELRNEVVHNGKRALDKEMVWDCLVATREFLENVPVATET